MKPVLSSPTASFPNPPRSTRPIPTAPTRTASATSSSATTTPTRATTRVATLAARRSRLTTFKSRKKVKCIVHLVGLPPRRRFQSVASADRHAIRESCLLSPTRHYYIWHRVPRQLDITLVVGEPRPWWERRHGRTSLTMLIELIRGRETGFATRGSFFLKTFLGLAGVLGSSNE